MAWASPTSQVISSTVTSRSAKLQPKSMRSTVESCRVPLPRPSKRKPETGRRTSCRPAGSSPTLLPSTATRWTQASPSGSNSQMCMAAAGSEECL